MKYQNCNFSSIFSSFHHPYFQPYYYFIYFQEGPKIIVNFFFLFKKEKKRKGCATVTTPSCPGSMWPPYWEALVARRPRSCSRGLSRKENIYLNFQLSTTPSRHENVNFISNNSLFQSTQNFCCLTRSSSHPLNYVALLQILDTTFSCHVALTMCVYIGVVIVNSNCKRKRTQKICHLFSHGIVQFHRLNHRIKASFTPPSPPPLPQRLRCILHSE